MSKSIRGQSGLMNRPCLDDGIGFNIEEALSKHKGLGLFNLQNRLHTIGGKVNLSSEPGKGVDYLFTVNL